MPIRIAEAAVRARNRGLDHTGVAWFGGKREHRVTQVLTVEGDRRLRGTLGLSPLEMECDGLPHERAKILLVHSRTST